MRVIHARMQIFHSHQMSSLELITWYLSILAWKMQGHQVIFYCDEANYTFIKRLHIDTLYDEINKDLFKNIKLQCDLKTFWAAPKLLAYQNEGIDTIVSDIDLFPLEDLSRFWKDYDIVVYANKEILGIHPYPPKEYLSTAENYTFPSWMNWEVQPLNTAITYFKNVEQKKEFLDTAFDYMNNNYGLKNNRMGVDMVFAEQRILAMCAAKSQATVGIVQPLNSRCINKNAVHLWVYKSLSSDILLPYNLYLFELLHNINYDLWNSLRDIEELKYLFEYVDKNGFVYAIPGIFQLIDYENKKIDKYETM